MGLSLWTDCSTRSGDQAPGWVLSKSYFGFDRFQGISAVLGSPRLLARDVSVRKRSPPFALSQTALFRQSGPLYANGFLQHYRL
jgi:hypothetical protein